jgi:hypothetical protein
MKIRAYIVLIIWGILLFEPVSANFNIETPYSACAKKQKVESSCSKSKCEKPAEEEEKDDCEKNPCNPLMSCPTGKFYLFGQSHLSVESFPLSTQKPALVNDNRLMKYMAECWHPPEII